MTEKNCKNCPEYKTSGQGIGGGDMKKGRCMKADKMVSRLKKCPLPEGK